MSSEMGMRKAAIIQFISKYASVLVQLTITAVLARLVTPVEFGVLAIVTVFTTFFSMFSDMGIGVAIVQFRYLNNDDMRCLFGFSIVLAIGIGVLFCAFSPVVTWIYGEPRLVPLCCASSLSLVFSTLNMVPNGIMLREHQFVQAGLRLVVSTLVSGVVSIALAAMGWGCYALVVQSNIMHLVVLVWNLKSCSIGRPIMHFMSTLREVFYYSAFQFASGLVNYFNRNLDNLLIGRFVGTEALGFYDKAYKLTIFPMSSFSSVIASVIQPFMAEHQDKTEVIFLCWKRVEKLCSLVGVVIAVLLFCCSNEIILILYGDRWVASVPILHALAVGVYAQMMGNPTGAFFQSLGRTDLSFACSLANTGLMVAAILLGLAQGDIVIVAWYVGIAFVGQLAFIVCFLIHKGFGQKASCVVIFLPEIVMGILSAFAGMVAGSFLPQDLLVQLFGKGLVSAGIMGIAYALTGRLRYLRDLLRR